MKKFRFLLLAVLLCGPGTSALQQPHGKMPFLSSVAVAQAHPIPPGIRQADQTEAQTQKNIPPPVGPHKTIDPEKLKHDADELAALASSIPTAIDQTTKGTIPKDLGEKLKRIEKLAKQIRNSLNP